MTSSVKPPSSTLTMDRDERVRRFGIECIGPSGDGIFFKAGTWRPGGEYIQKLIIRNVSVQVKKLKYKLPSSRYFSMAYPEPIVLSPGLATEVDVVFRPVEYEPYDDTIYIKMLDGVDGNGFHIPVRATIDNLALRAPTGLDLGYCATHQITQLIFKLENVGEVDAPYKWEVPAPFTLFPSEGIVPVGRHHDITLSIRPEDASVFVAQAVCRVGEGVHAIIPEPIIMTKLSAIGKFAYINLSDALVSFEEVVSGVKPERKEIALLNNSVVPAEFGLIRLDNDRDEVFVIEPKGGIIPPRSEVAVTIEYRALAMGCYSHDRYAFRTPGNCNTILNLRGMSMAPRVKLYKEVVPSKENAGSTSGPNGTMVSALSLTGSIGGEEGAPLFSFNFRDVEIGLVSTRIMYISNDSQRAVPFSVTADENGAFKMSPKQGVIPPLTKSFPVTLVFAPTKPMNYYRRFFVLVEDAMPLFYDCLGTGFIRAKGEIKEQRPAPIRHAHVQAYRNRNGQGAGGLSPDELDSLYESPETPSSFYAQIGRMGTRALSVTDVPRPVTRTGESVRNSVAPAHEFFISPSDSTAKEITVNKAQINFGFAPSRSTSQPKSIVINNNTNGKVMVQWLIPIVGGMDNKKDEKGSNSREHQMINIDRAEKELAQLQAFSVSPAVGEIPPGSSMSFDITFCPKQASRNFISELEAYVYFKNQRTFRLVNDYSLTPPWMLGVSAIGHTFASGQLLAKARCSGGSIFQNKLLFPCAFKGESIYQTFRISNTSNLPCLFSLHIGWGDDVSVGNRSESESRSTFSVKPSVGEIAAESFILVCVRFSPQEVKRYTDLLRLVINGDDGGRVILEGQGALPYLIVPDLLVDSTPYPENIWGIPSKPPSSIPKGTLGDLFMRPTSVGLTSQRVITLKNASRLPLRYRISLPSHAQGVLSITPMSGTLKGNDDIALKVIFSPQQAQMHTLAMNVNVYPLGGRPKRVLDSNQPGPVEAPELLQQFTVMIKAQGEVGAITFDPPHTDIPVRLVHTSEQRAIWLENVSDAELHYCLYYREEFEPDGVEIKLERETIVSDILRFVDATAGAEKSPVAFQHSIFCEKSEGKIAARSRSRLVFTYKPCKSGLFDFSIFVKVKAVVADDDEQAMVNNDEAIVLRMASSVSGLVDEAQLIEDLAALPLTASIQARAAFPKLLFEDIRTESDMQISDIDYLWNRFSFSRLNYDLSVPLTAKEIVLNNSSSPDLSQLVVYPCEFSPAVQHSPTQTVDIVLRNHGYLETAFKLSLPNEKQLELENWCSEDEPSEALNRLICIIEELRLFSIEPKVGRLGPGESMVVRMTYKHTSLKYGGLHNLPVLVRISQGKQFYLDLRGRTLAAPTNNRRSSVKIMEPTRLGTGGGGLLPPNTAGGGSLMSAGPGGDRGSLGTAGGGLLRTGVRTAGGGGSDASGSATPANSLPDILLVLGSAKVPDNVVVLDPVPIGLSYIATSHVPITEGTRNDGAPLQRIELNNVSAFHIQYEVIIGNAHESAVSSDEFVRRENHNLEVLTIANPKGHIPTGSSVYLELYFYPVEAREYQLPFYIKYSILPPTVANSLFQQLGDMDSLGLMSPANNSAVGFSNMPSMISKAATPTSRRGMTGGTSRGGVGNKAASSRASAQAAAAAEAAAAAAAAAHTLILSAKIQCVGYDPRFPKPAAHESKYIGGLPPLRPVLQSPDKLVTFYEDAVDFGVVPQRAVVNRVLLLTNRSATGVFDFAFDTTSCSLCTDNLLTFTPVSGRVEPGGQAVIQVTLHAMAQSIICVTEHVKVIVREVLKAAARSRGGTKALLLNKLRARKAQNAPHESVVSRLTVARSMYVITEPELPVFAIDSGDMGAEAKAEQRLGQRPAGKFPTTISEKGETVVPDVARALRHSLGATHAGVTFAEENEEIHGASGSGFAEMLQLNSNSTSGPPSPTDSHATSGVLSRTSRSAGGGVGDDTRSRVSAGGSRHSASRGTVDSGASGRYSTGSGGSGGGGHQLFGSTYILMVRIKGSILAPQTIDRLFARNTAFEAVAKNPSDTFSTNYNMKFLQPCREELLEFLPPVGKKFYDENVREELQRARSKPRVNVSLVFGRDAELRNVGQEVFASVTRLLLGEFTVRNVLQEVLQVPDATASSSSSSAADESAVYGVPLCTRPPLSAAFLTQSPTATGNQTGVFAQEVFASVRNRSLHQLLILDLKALGHSSKAALSERSEEEEEEEEERLLQLDERAREDLWLRDEDFYALPYNELRVELLDRLGLSRSTAFRRDWETTEASLISSGRASAPSTAREAGSTGGVNLLVLKDWTYTLSKEAQRDLLAALRRAKDQRAVAALPTNVANETNERDMIVWSESRGDFVEAAVPAEAVSSPLQTISNEESPAEVSAEDSHAAKKALLSLSQRVDFYGAAADTLNQLFLQIVREIVETPSAEDEGVENL